ncbi:MAG: transglutaminase family protein, partial [Candidatus Pacearchaeota archaeon]
RRENLTSKFRGLEKIIKNGRKLVGPLAISITLALNNPSSGGLRVRDKSDSLTQRSTFENIPRIQEYGDSLEIILGKVNEDSLPNKEIQTKNRRIIFTDYRNINQKEITEPTEEHRKIISYLFDTPPYYTTDPLNENYKTEIIKKLPENFNKLDLSEALLCIADIVGDRMSYDLKMTYMTYDANKAYEIRRGVCKHYAALYKDVFDVVNQLNPNLNKLITRVVNLESINHAYIAVACVPKRDKNSILITFLDPTIYDGEMEERSNDTTINPKQIEDYFGAYDRFHADDFKLMELFLNKNLENDKEDLGSIKSKGIGYNFFEEYYKNSSRDDINHFRAGWYIYELSEEEFKINFLDEILKSEHIINNYGDYGYYEFLKFQLEKLRFKENKISHEEFLKNTPLLYRHNALIEIGDKLFKDRDYKSLLKIYKSNYYEPHEMDVWEMQVQRYLERCLSSPLFIIIKPPLSEISVVFNEGYKRPNLAQYVKAAHMAYIEGDTSLKKSEVINLYKILIEKTDKTISSYSRPSFFEDKKYEKSYNNIKKSVSKNKLPNLKDLEKIYSF